MDSFIYVYSLFGPFLIWPVELFLPYPYIIEELFKAFVVYFNRSLRIGTFVIAGLLFAVTETVLYSININILGSVNFMILRFISSTLLHSTTFVVIYLFAKRSKRLVSIGFLVSMTIHFFYNSFIPSF